MFCKNCGRELKEGAKFCPGCGTSVVQTPPERRELKPVREQPIKEEAEQVKSAQKQSVKESTKEKKTQEKANPKILVIAISAIAIATIVIVILVLKPWVNGGPTPSVQDSDSSSESTTEETASNISDEEDMIGSAKDDEETAPEINFDIDNTEEVGEYIFPDSNVRLLTDADLAPIAHDKTLLAIARNEMYARYGYQFTTNQVMIDYFGSKSWYVPVTTDQQAIYNSFSDVEKRNVDIIKEYEARLP